MADFWRAGIEPKRNFRWVVHLTNFGESATWLAKTVDKPSWKTSDVPHKFINHTFYYPGRVEWNPVTIKLIDPVVPVDASSNLLKILRSSGYNFPAGGMEAASQSITKAKAAGALGEVKITQLGPGPNGAMDGTLSDVVDEWKLVDAFVTEVKLGSLDYGNEEMVELEMQIRYDWAYMTHAGGEAGGWAAGEGENLIPQPAAYGANFTSTFDNSST